MATTAKAFGGQARAHEEIDDLAVDQLERFAVLLVYRVAILTEAGIEVVPTFRTPHVTLAFHGDLDDGLARLALADHERRDNPYHCDVTPRGGE